MLNYFVLIIILSVKIENLHSILNNNLAWPEVYTVKIDHTSLVTGFEYTMEYWYDSVCNMSRIDYYKGDVTKILDLNDLVKYEIYPQTTEEETTKVVCKIEWTNITLDDKFLPSTTLNNFKEIATENIAGQDVNKFYFRNYDSNSTDERYTLWAIFSEDLDTWIPVKYESYEYNTEDGSLQEHNKMDFYNFKNIMDDDVFNISTYDCHGDEDEDADIETTTIDTPPIVSDDDLDNAFTKFKLHHKRDYRNTEEHQKRKEVFQENLRLVTSVNSKDLSYKLAINKFSDLTKQEMRKYKGLRQRREAEDINDENAFEYEFPYNETDVIDYVKDLPKNYDLRLYGLVSPARVQGECGACWAFATTAVVEGALAKNKSRRFRLSEQAILDCAWSLGGLGCGGGYDTDAYKWIAKHGLPTEEEYGPYMMQNGLCRIENMKTLHKIEGFADVTPFSDDALKIALYDNGPISVSIHASSAFSSYSEGIFYDSNCSNNTDDLDHELVLVGYGTDGEDTYWILRNSWGPDWGIDGYIYISTENNNCGVTNKPTYVVL